MTQKHCQKCGLPLAFKKLPSGRWCPTNVDGSDHWDICRETMLAAMSPEQRAALQRRDADRARGVWTGTAKRVYAGSVPPWDESLGSFREFTADELASGMTAKSAGKAPKRMRLAA